MKLIIILRIILLSTFSLIEVAFAHQINFYETGGEPYSNYGVVKITVRTSCIRNFSPSAAHHSQKSTAVEPGSSKASINFGRLCRNRGWVVKSMEIKVTKGQYTRHCQLSKQPEWEHYDPINFSLSVSQGEKDFVCGAEKM